MENGEWKMEVSLLIILGAKIFDNPYYNLITFFVTEYPELFVILTKINSRIQM
jgi:hypothetical protein